MRFFRSRRVPAARQVLRRNRHWKPRFDLLEERRVLATFANATAITINDNAAASPYPSAIVASNDNVTATVVAVSATLTNLSHTRPDDVDILLVSPAGGAVNALLMSDAGGANAVVDVTLTFAAGGGALPDATQITSGTFLPGNFDGGDGTPEDLPAPAPATAGASLAVFNGLDFQGTWNLFVSDDSAGETGTIDGGWSLALQLGGDVVISAGTEADDTIADTFDISVTATHLVASVNGNEVFNELLAGITKLTIVGSSDNDEVNFSGGDVELDFSLEFSGGGGTDLLNVDDAFVKDALGDGLSATNFDTVTVDSSQFTSNDLHGIQLDSCGTVTLTGVTANENMDDGIEMVFCGAVQLTNVTANGNMDDGVRLDTVGSVTLSNVTASDNSNDGVDAVAIDSFSANTLTASTNGNAGLSVDDVGGGGVVALVSVAANGNLSGAIINNAPSFSDTDGTYSNNANGGLIIFDIAGNITLNRTTADNNDADGDTDGSGVAIEDGVDGDSVSLGGNLLVRGGRFRVVDDGMGLPEAQNRGLLVADVGGSVTFNDSESPGAVQSNVATGNAVHGVEIIGTGANSVSLTGGEYSSNGFGGMAVLMVGGVTVTGLTAQNNSDSGFFVSSAASVSVADSSFLNNANSGLLVSDVSGNVTLVRLVADNNDTNNDANGDGFRAEVNLAAVAIGGNLLVQGGQYRDTLGVNDHQERGLYVQSIAGSVTFENAAGPASTITVTGNEGKGLDIDDGGTTASITNGTFSSNGNDGMQLSGFSGAVTLGGSLFASGNGDEGLDFDNVGSLSITGATVNLNSNTGLEASSISGTVNISSSTFNDNGQTNSSGDGIELTNVGDVVFVSVTASLNDPGVNIAGAASFSDTDGTYSHNDDGGIVLEDIAGNVTLIRTTADNNDADNDGTGDGLNAGDGGDGDAFAIGGNLLVQGSRFRLVDDGMGPAEHQNRGVNIASLAAASTVTFNDSTGTVQSNAVTGNEADGVFIGTGGTTVTFTGGNYDNNFDDGIDVDTVSTAVALSGVSASNNGDVGFELSNVSNGTGNAAVNLSDLVLAGNGTGGGNLSMVDIVNYTTDTTAMNVVDTLVVTATQFQRTAPAQQAVAYGTVASLNLNTADGDDIIQVQSTAVGAVVTVNAGAGADTINLGNAGTLDALLHPVTVNGNDGTDTLNFDDSNKATGDAYSVSNVQTLRTAGALQFNYGTVEQLTLASGAGDDTFNVDAANLNLNVSLTAGNGDSDVLTLTAGAVNTVRHFFTNATDGRVEVDGDATDNGGLAEFQVEYTGLDPITDNLGVVHRVFTFANGDDGVTLSEGAAAADGILRLSTNNLTSETVDFLAPTGTLTLNLDSGGTGQDTFTFASFDSAATTTNLQVNGGTGNDTFNLAPTPASVPAALANLGVDGQAGNDMVPIIMLPGGVTLTQVNVGFASMITGPAALSEGQSAPLGTTGIVGADAPLTFAWSVVGGGTFDNAASATPNFTAPNVAINGVVNVTVDITDADGDVSQAMLAINVNNTVPVASAGGPYQVSEGLTVGLTAAGTTHPAEDVSSLNFAWDLDGDGQFDDAVGITPTFSAASLDGPLVINNVRVRVTDADGDMHDSPVTSITVNNAAPTADAGGPYTVSEGQSIAMIGAGNDVQGDLPLTFTWDLDGDGIFGEIGAAAERGNETGQNPTYTAPNVSGNQQFTVTVRVTDGEGGQTDDTATVNVNDNAPTVLADAGGPYSVNEGGTVALVGIGNGGNAPLTFAWDLDGDGTFGESGAGATRGDENVQNPTFNAAALDGPTSVTVTLRVIDNDGDVVTDTATVNVLNVIPTADAGGPYTVNEGGSTLLSGLGTDIAGDTLTFAWDLDGDGLFGESGASATRGDENVQNPTFNAPFVPSTQQFTVTVRVTDDEGGQNTDTAQITVTNTPPTANAGGPYSVVEGNAVVLAGGGSGTNTPLSFAWDFDNDGQFDDAAGATPTFNASAISGGTSPTIVLQVTDADGDTATASTTVNIIDSSTQISGSVYLDSNNNGLFDVGEHPIPGVTITLTGTLVSAQAFAARSVETSTSGTYSFSNLQAGTYTLTETHPAAFVDGLDTAGTVAGVGRGTAGNDVISNLTVGGNEIAINYNFGERFLTHGGSGAASSRWFLASAPSASQVFASLVANLSAVLGPTPIAPPVPPPVVTNLFSGSGGEGEGEAALASAVASSAVVPVSAPVASVRTLISSSPLTPTAPGVLPAEASAGFAALTAEVIPSTSDAAPVAAAILEFTSWNEAATADPLALSVAPPDSFSLADVDSVYHEIGDSGSQEDEDALFSLLL